MDKNQPDKTPGKSPEVNNYLKFTGAGFQMLAIIGVFAYAGYRIDESAAHKVKWATAALALIGVFISLYIVIRSLKE